MRSQTQRLNAAVDAIVGVAAERDNDIHKVLLDLDIDMYNRIKARAKREERTVQGQVRYMLKRAENLNC